MAEVSVIVPVYNVENYLIDCVESLLRQSFKEISIILVDDGSTDNSGRICDSYCQTYPNLCKAIHKKNGGLSSARNLGLDIAANDRECQWILFVDSDDYIDSDLIEKSYERATKTKSDIVCFEMPKVYDNKISEYITYQNESVFFDDSRFQLLFGEHGSGDYMCDKMFRKELFKGIRFPLNRAYEDMHISHLLFDRANTVSTLKGYSYYYRQLKNSISNSKKNICALFHLLDASNSQYVWFSSNYVDYDELAFSKLISSYAKVSVILHDRKLFVQDRKLIFIILKWSRANRKRIQTNQNVNSSHKKICMNASYGFIYWIFAPIICKYLQG